MAADLKMNVGISDKSPIERIMDNMSYGPAPESPDVARAWLDEHGRSFGFFINNQWVKPSDRKYNESINPVNDEVLARTLQGNAEDIECAVKAAKEALPGWQKRSAHSRARVLYSVARHLQKHQRLLTVLESMDNGKSFRESRDADIPTVIRHFYHHAGWAQLMPEEMSGWKPVGVVGAIVPWNFPLMLLTWKVCPALAMGNTVILKPATLTRLSALLLAEICAVAGLPPGVLNVVTGSGSMGSILALHPHVDKVAFTGSTEVGQMLRKSLAGSGKKLSLELGGKSPVVVFESADLDSTVEGIVDAIWFNQGQVCSAGSRLVAQESIYDKLIEKLRSRLKKFRLGDSLDKAIDMGAIVDENQRKSIEEFVESAREEGAEVIQFPECIPATGCYYPPTLITNIQTVSRVFMEEIFGPVLVAVPFRTAKEAIALANNTNYGLGGSVWTEQMSLSLEVALELKAGTVWINSHNLFDAAAGFGGYRQSGYGRDGGKEGLFEYVKPAWQSDVRLKVDFEEMHKFGIVTPGRPSLNAEIPVTESIDHTYKLYYGGAQKRPDGQYSRPVISTEKKLLGWVPDSNRKDVRNAVEAAHKAAHGWGKRAAHNRAQILYYLAENLEQRKTEFAGKMSDMSGKPVTESMTEVEISIERLFYWAAYADKFGGSVQETTLYGCTIKIHEAVGVIGIVCPDDYPLLAFVSLFAPAIVRGNVVVIAPSEKNPLCALDLYQVFETSDLPGGVVNILSGSSDLLAKNLSEHQDIQAVWYFGSAVGSTFVEHASHANLKRTWVNYGVARKWEQPEQGQGQEFLYHSVQVKNIWVPIGDIYP